jgi:hypothetical protein
MSRRVSHKEIPMTERRDHDNLLQVGDFMWTVGHWGERDLILMIPGIESARKPIQIRIQVTEALSDPLQSWWNGDREKPTIQPEIAGRVWVRNGYLVEA